jgi:hypothetical protein
MWDYHKRLDMRGHTECDWCGKPEDWCCDFVTGGLKLCQECYAKRFEEYRRGVILKQAQGDA